MVTMNYETIKRIAKESGRRITDYLALAPGNDPFYVTPGRAQDGAWFARQLEMFGVTGEFHLRRIHYLLVTQETPVKRPDGTAYENTEKCWDALNVASLGARYTQAVSSDRFTDRRNPDPEFFHFESGEPEPKTVIVESADLQKRGWLMYELPAVPELEDLPEYLPDLPGYSITELPLITEQPILTEVWAEKTTMNDVLIPICEKYGVNLIPGMGELSAIACHMFVNRCRRLSKPGRILYISDFDPAGVGMPVAVARKIEWYQRTFAEFADLDVRLEPIALTAEQVAQWDLPRIPVKDSDKRKARFEECNGEGQVELDALEALHPGELARIVTDAILQYHDPNLRRETAKAYADFEDYLERINDAEHSIFADRRDELEAEYEELHNEWQAIRLKFAELVEPFKGEIEQLTARADDMRERAKELHEDVADHCAAHIGELNKYKRPDADLPEEPDGQLYDSRRDYDEQLAVYKRHKKGHNGED